MNTGPALRSRRPWREESAMSHKGPQPKRRHEREAGTKLCNMYAPPRQNSRYRRALCTGCQESCSEASFKLGRSCSPGDAIRHVGLEHGFVIFHRAWQTAEATYQGSLGCRSTPFTRSDRCENFLWKQSISQADGIQCAFQQHVP